MRINGVTYHHPLANIMDSSGTGAGGGGADPPTGKSYSFDGVDDYVLADGAASVVDFNNSPHSISCWFNVPPTIAPLQMLWSFANSAAAASMYMLGVSAAGQIWLYGRGDVGGVYPIGLHPVVFGSGYDDGAWHHAAITYDGATDLNVYIDGVAQAPVVVAAGALTSDILSVGARRSATATSLALLGMVHRASVYNSELTAGEVAAVYNAGSPPDEMTLTPPPLNYYRFGNGDTRFRVLKDYGTSPQDGLAYNMALSPPPPGAIVSDAP